MGDVSKAIADFIADEIKLSQSDISSAVASREWFLDRIKNEIARRTDEPVLYEPEPFVRFGSYFKRTKVATVDEFDILVVLDCNTGHFVSGGVEIGKGLGSVSPNPRYYDKYKKSDGSGVSPAKMLNWLKGVVQTVVSSFGGEAPERNGQAVTAIIKSKNLKIDLVPAGIFQSSNGRIFYDIPKGDANNSWILTAPREDIDLLNSVAKNKEYFRDVIRLCKYIRTAYNFKVSSFAIETAIVQYGMSNYWFSSLALNVYETLSHLASAFRSGVINDPLDFVNNNLIDGIESLEWYADRIDKIVTDLKALEKEPDQKKVRQQVDRIFKNT